jgi:hypothetical protein
LRGRLSRFGALDDQGDEILEDDRILRERNAPAVLEVPLAAARPQLDVFLAEEAIGFDDCRRVVRKVDHAIETERQNSAAAAVDTHLRDIANIDARDAHRRTDMHTVDALKIGNEMKEAGISFLRRAVRKRDKEQSDGKHHGRNGADNCFALFG